MDNFDTKSSIRSRILVVDDEPRNLRLIQGIFEKMPYDIIAVTTGREALAILRSSAIDLVLLDIMMPKLDGYNVCKAIKCNDLTKSIPVIMVTALNDMLDRVKAMEAGADDFLAKPIDATEITIRVRSMLRLRESLIAQERIVQERLQFMSALAHDIKSPLSSLLINLDILKLQTDNHNKVRNRALQRMKLTCDYINGLADSLLNYYQTATGQYLLQYEQFNLVELISQVWDLVMPLIDNTEINAVLETVPNCEVYADPNIIRQVLVNLLSNAVKYNHHDGQIRLRVFDLKEHPYDVLDSVYPQKISLPNHGLVFEVCDTGIGIPGYLYDAVFVEFKRLGRTEINGVGIGLSVSKKLVELHHGSIWFTSQEGKGATFAFYIPKLD